MRLRSTVMLAAASSLILLSLVLLLPFRAADTTYAAPDGVAAFADHRQAPPRLHADLSDTQPPTHARGYTFAAEPHGYRVGLPSAEFIDDSVKVMKRPFCSAGL